MPILTKSKKYDQSSFPKLVIRDIDAMSSLEKEYGLICFIISKLIFWKAYLIAIQLFSETISKGKKI